MTKTVCDICGKEMPPSIIEKKIQYLNFAISSMGRIWDVCSECRNDLWKWMKERKSEKGCEGNEQSDGN